MLKIDYITVGTFATNTYFLIDNKSNTVVIVDPAGSGKEIEDYVNKNSLKIEKIIITHGHPDHYEALGYIKNIFDVPVYMCPKDSLLTQFHFDLPSYDFPLNEGDIITFGDEDLRVIETPGHTPGSVCILGKNFLLTGDTIFKDNIGRIDLGGDMNVMTKTLKEKFNDIPGDTILYPGHGPSTTMKEERENNLFIWLLFNIKK